MQVKEIKIENYKGIVDADVTFDERMNVFVGSNGAGKTTLLEAIGICTKVFVNNFRTSLSSKASFLSYEDINYENNFATIYGEIVDSQFSNAPLHIYETIGAVDETTIEKAKTFKRTFVQGTQKFSNFASKGIDVSLPIVRYYPANRQIIIKNNNRSKSLKIFRLPQLEVWENLLHNNNSYAEFSHWFIEKENQELRMQRDAENFNVKNNDLEGIRKAVGRAFELLNGKKYELKSSEIKRKGSHSTKPTLVFKNKANGKIELIEDKSDGEKTIIALIADIAYFLTLANSGTGRKHFLKGKGVVLIDEIEAHLHPKWQREIIPLLTKLFPNIQFFITTHSPQVVASVNSDKVFMCEDFKFNKINTKSKGTDTNTLLETVFGADARPKKYADLSDKFDDLIDESADIADLQMIIDEVIKMEQEDPATDINPLSEELQFRLSAYQFEIEHEAN